MIELIAGFIILSIILLLGLFLIFPLRFGIRYEKTVSYEKFHIYVSLFGILIRIPIHNKKGNDAGESKKNKPALKSSSKKELTFASFKNHVDAFGEVFEVSKNELRAMLSYVRKHLSCKEVDFNIRFGLDDAAKTGIATGAVWTSGTLLLKLVDALIGIKKIRMNVYPDFNEKKFEIYVKTILIMRPIHFIIIARKINETIKFIKNKINNM